MYGRSTDLLVPGGVVFCDFACLEHGRALVYISGHNSVQWFIVTSHQELTHACVSIT
jgi:hypothetical protein